MRKKMSGKVAPCAKSSADLKIGFLVATCFCFVERGFDGFRLQERFDQKAEYCSINQAYRNRLR